MVLYVHNDLISTQETLKIFMNHEYLLDTGNSKPNCHFAIIFSVCYSFKSRSMRRGEKSTVRNVMRSVIEMSGFASLTAVRRNRPINYV